MQQKNYIFPVFVELSIKLHDLRLKIVSFVFIYTVASFFLVSTVKADVENIQGIQPGWAIDDQGNVLITDEVADRLASTSSKYVRINFRLGPYAEDSEEFYSKYDEIVNRLTSRNLIVVGLMSNESWPGAQRDWTANSYELTGGDGYNLYIDQYGYAFERIARHFEDRIYYWEIWNEPNSWAENPSEGVFRGGSFIYPSNFAAMLTHVHSLVHYYSNLNVQIISGGLLSHDLNGEDWQDSGAAYLDKTYDMGINYTGKFAWAKETYGTYPLDAVGQHIYIDQDYYLEQQKLISYLDFFQAVIDKWGDQGKKTWITEFGWQSSASNEFIQSLNMQDSLKLMTSKNYVQSAIWFQLDDNPAELSSWGLYSSDGSEKMSLNAFKGFEGFF